MASSSNSSVQKSFKYDVFLSFRGEDTRKNFSGHLYEALKQKGIETYKDEEKIEQGERINAQLFKSIEDSKFYIIVFSKNYASSSWCLDELVKIMECQKMTEHTAFPIFYDVEPTEVRKQSGAVKEALAEHEKKEAAGKWRDAMKELANLAGWELKSTANGDESKSIQIIVDAIFKKLHSTNLSADGKLVGMETRISDVFSSLKIGTEDVRMIGIRGIGGGGKTTLARAVYDKISNYFEGKSFVENVREVSKTHLFGLKTLQEQILRDVFADRNIFISGVSDGKMMMIQMMRRQKVLVVLDDVDCIGQLEALAGEPNWFKSGSRIIITTRDEQVLRAHGVNFVHDVNLLSSREAICLFSRYGFRKETPVRGYEELSGQVVQYADGLPLTIKVLGSFLCGKDKLEWQDAIDRLKKIPLKETLEKLELSYTSLEDEYKEIFLDIACILKGMYKEYAIRILESCGFHARNGLKVLEQRSLITISKDEVLGMHDHIEEMGKNIVRRSHPDEPNKHSHLWIDEEIEDILANDMGNEETRCLKFDMRENSKIVMKGLGKMKKLRHLRVNFAKFDSETNCESDPIFDDKSNRNSRIVMKGLGKMKILRYLKLTVLGKIEQKFERDEATLYFSNSLKYLKCRNYPFLYLPKTFEANNLVGLEMKDSRMVELWEKGEKKDLKKLKYVALVHSNLMTFDLGLTPNLKTLFLEYCTHFVKLQVSVACPNLKFLTLSKSRLRSLDLELLPNLESLDLQQSHELVKINAPVGSLKKVGYLNLSGSLRFKDFEFRDRSKPMFSRSLATLSLYGDFKDLCPLHPNNNLPKFRFHCYYADCTPSVGNVEKLISFGLCVCTDLKKISDIICSLQCLQKLTVYCNIPKFPKDLGQLECLEELHLSSSEVKHLPDSICMLKRLKYLSVIHCDLLEKLPEDLGKLECLEKLHVRSKKIECLLDGICMLKRLKCLYVTDCCLGKLPEDIGQFESLEWLNFSGTRIKRLPDSICVLKHLKFLNLHRCALLEKLPEDLGRLECLERLDISLTGISHLPQSIFGLKGLLIAAPQELLELYEFPSEIKTTTSPLWRW